MLQLRSVRLQRIWRSCCRYKSKKVFLINETETAGRNDARLADTNWTWRNRTNKDGMSVDVVRGDLAEDDEDLCLLFVRTQAAAFS